MKQELLELLEDIQRGYPPAWWTAELLWMVYRGEISQSSAKIVQEEYMKRRVKLYEEIRGQLQP